MGLGGPPGVQGGGVQQRTDLVQRADQLGVKLLVDPGVAAGGGVQAEDDPHRGGLPVYWFGTFISPIMGITRTQRTRRDRPVQIDAEYARISRDKRGAAEGMETQRAENADAADELSLTIGASYVDNDLSAYSGVERPDYERLLADIAAGKIGTLII